MDVQKSRDTPTTILMLPWIGYGHLSAYLELAKVLSRRNNFLIYFCSTPVNLDSIKPRLIPSSSIQFVELHLPSSPEFPPHLHTTNALPPRLTPTLHKAFAAAASPFEAILQTLCPHLLIYDSLQQWAPQIASSLNIPAINFNTTAASIISHALHNINYPDTKFPLSDWVLHNYWKGKYTTANEATLERIRRVRESFLYCLSASRDITLISSCREIEGEYMDYLSVLLKKKVIAVGPLVYEPREDDEDEDYSRIKNWLDKKEALSTVLVSFGSEFFPSKEEMEEIGCGLEESGANFIWVIRSPKGEENKRVEEALPEGFVEKAGERAMIVKEWAPQGKILKHRSIGGFVSHCGWNSVMESIMLGVPVIAVPMHVDQPYNAGLVEEAGLGVEAKRDPDGMIQREEVAKLIREVVVDKSREDLRTKVIEMGEILRSKGDEKIDEMVAQISLLLKI
ncbi:UDP-glucosyltransferase 29-like [Cucumis sativus]|uniref:Glycosyltransferase n=2 Tax=Cucumis sativus TaxID=3659 RepID=A0A0A0L1Q0_CUCSA|nr:UDP-glucosyltransferase 29 [Cucumis sativus]XP_031740426.1 UDP-glucosyltransferase 29-like [Cucumis sativus]KAE8637498.1 hypothetical protein CSA_018537 [Cucumis sativus]KGN54051.1 hypothetical protein Csa_018078 [Cucumis sativus]